MSFCRKNYFKIVTIVGMILCLMWVFLVNTQPYADFRYYNYLAKSIANGGKWGDTYTSVGYAIILGGIYKVFGCNILYGKIFNLIFTFINYVLVYKILNKMDISLKKRKVIYTIFVFFPSNIFYNSVLASEILFTTILLLITLVYYKENIKHKYFIIGVLTGINAMIKPFFPAFFLVILITELILKVKVKIALKNSLVVLVMSLVIIFPLIYRNSKLMGMPTYISNNSGVVLYINNNSQNHDGRWKRVTELKDSIANTKEYDKANVTERNKMLGDAAKKWIVQHPIQFVNLGFKRLVNTYFIGEDMSYSLYGVNLSNPHKVNLMINNTLIKDVILIPTIIYIFILSIKTIKKIFKKQSINKYNIFSLVCFYMFTSVYFISEGQGRYSFPLMFIIIYFFSNILEKKKII